MWSDHPNDESRLRLEPSPNEERIRNLPPRMWSDHPNDESRLRLEPALTRSEAKRTLNLPPRMWSDHPNDESRLRLEPGTNEERSEANPQPPTENVVKPSER